MNSSTTTTTSRELARRTGGRVDVRTDPMRSRLRLRDLATADSHTVDLSFTCGVLALDKPVERQMLAEAFLSDRDAVSSDDVLAHFSSALRDGASRLAGGQAAEHWLTDAGRKELVEA